MLNYLSHKKFPVTVELIRASLNRRATCRQVCDFHVLVYVRNRAISLQKIVSYLLGSACIAPNTAKTAVRSVEAVRSAYRRLVVDGQAAQKQDRHRKCAVKSRFTITHQSKTFLVTVEWFGHATRKFITVVHRYKEVKGLVAVEVEEMCSTKHKIVPVHDNMSWKTLFDMQNTLQQTSNHWSTNPSFTNSMHVVLSCECNYQAPPHSSTKREKQTSHGTTSKLAQLSTAPFRSAPDTASCQARKEAETASTTACPALWLGPSAPKMPASAPPQQADQFGCRQLAHSELSCWLQLECMH